MAKLIGRNDPCPCGSGKKYKKCCLGKKDNPDYSDIANFPQIYRNTRKAARFRECIYPDHSSCSEKIISSHSIQNNRILSKIADNGIVYMPCPKTDLTFTIQKEYGRKEASTFTGFCSYHDKVVFQPIDDKAFFGTKEQVFLYIYRAFAFEYHRKKEAVRMEQSFFAQKPSIADIDTRFDGKTAFELAVTDFEEEKKLFDAALLKKDYDVLTAIVWEFDGFSNFAASGGEVPTVDFENNQIQDLLNPHITAKHIYISVFPEDNKTYAIMAWFKQYDPLFASIRKRLLNATDEERRNYINNTLPMISENICIKPSVWDKIPKQGKEEFTMLFMGMADIAAAMGQKVDRFEKPSFDLFAL